ncbi:type II and III secretion system protein family protein [Delftia tsuruhatensis]|uniref:type II and III secretion system protein family protein n=1 Tax=Delftia tsuruhatensis TaxID=180282 RepID=UPI001EF468D0|nr:pilus assembly protein N-terminal domain-containing protein [Delftia tsuruhatensis]
MPGPVAASAAPLSLYVGQVRVLAQSGVDRVAIGNGKLLTASVVADRQVVLMGESPGTTTLYVWLRNGRQIQYEVSISADNNERTAADLRRLLSYDPGVSVQTVGDRVVLDGTYANQASAEKIQKIAKAYPLVLNLVRERPEEQYTVVPEPMVQLDVKVVEVRKRALDNIGVKWSNLGVAGPTFATSGYFYANSTFRGLNQEGYPVTNSARPFISYFGLATQITSVLNFLESNGDSWTLAEPRISSVSGGASKVRVGGEVPIPVSSGFGQISVVYKPYGVILEFKPVIDKAGNVRSTIVAEVSQPDRSNGTGEFVAFSTNRTETEVSLRQNETLVISGLLKSVGARNKEGIPVIGRAPVVGRLFSTQELSNEQTEMLVVVTPRLHTPAADRAALLASESAYGNLQEVRSMIERKLAR